MQDSMPEDFLLQIVWVIFYKLIMAKGIANIDYHMAAWNQTLCIITQPCTKFV